jgi:PKD repeat protein
VNIKEKLNESKPRYIAIISIFIIASVIALIPLYSNLGLLNINQVDVDEVDYETKINPTGVLISQENGTYINNNILVEFESNTVKESKSVNLPRPGLSLVVDPNNLSASSIRSITLKDDKGEILKKKNFSRYKSTDILTKGKTYYIPNNKTLTLSVEDFIEDKNRIQYYSWNTGKKIIENENFSQRYQQNRTYNASLNMEYKSGYNLNRNFTIKVGSNYNNTQTDIYFRIQPNQTVYLSAKNFNLTNVQEYRWSFGDGSDIKYGRDVKHEYIGIGEYNVTLNAVYEEKETLTRSKKIDVYDGSPDTNNYSNISGEIEYNQNGYRFKFNTNINNSNNLTYEWVFGNGNQTVTDSNSVEYEYAEYGEYTVELNIKDQDGKLIESTKKNIETNVLVIMGNEPYKVESVSGNHENLLLPNNDIGDLNPQISFREDFRYVIKNIPEDIEFVDKEGNELLTQSGNGTMEDNPYIKWKENKNSVEFTMTENLGEVLYKYK